MLKIKYTNDQRFIHSTQNLSRTAKLNDKMFNFCIHFMVHPV